MEWIKFVSGGSTVLCVLLSLLFNSCLSHSFLPEDLVRVIIVPITKDKNGDICSIGNYRPISLSTLVSKVLEAVLLHRCAGFLDTTENQFAYKENHGTDMAITILKDITLEYNKRNTPVYSCFMDMSKAFDRVCHAYLFKKMLNRAIPKYVVSILNTDTLVKKCQSNGEMKCRGNFVSRVG